ncbi:FAD-dependent oxidoreductase, partial [bacterium]
MGAGVTRHIAVIGAGVVGLSVADALLDRGFRVTVLEKDAQEGDGCSFGNGGIVVPSHFVPLAAPGMVMLGLRMMADRRSPFGVESLTNFQTLSWMARFAASGTKAHVERCAPLLRDLNLASREIYGRLVGELGAETGFERRGLLMLSKTAAAHHAEERLAEQATKLGLKTASLDAAGLRKLEPGLDMDVMGGIHFEDDAHLSPPAFMRGLRARVIGRGGEVRAGQTVSGFRKEGGRIAAVVSGEGELAADEFVLAAGAWSGELAATLGLRLPMLAGRGYGITASNPPQ